MGIVTGRLKALCDIAPLITALNIDRTMLAAYPAFLDYLLSVYTGTLQQPTPTLENTRDATRRIQRRPRYQDSDPNYEGRGGRGTRNFDISLLLYPFFFNLI